MRAERLRRAVLLLLCLFLLPAACRAQRWPEMKKTGELALSYAREFTAEDYEGGYTLLTVSDGQRLLILPEGKEAPEALDADIRCVAQPLSGLYMAASSAMDLVRALGALDAVGMTSTQAKDWTIPEVARRVASDEILYIGKYSAPDFEALLEMDCPLAVESTMIWHAPDIKEQIEALGIPVLVERSSYEESPLARLEWIKLYGCLLGKKQEAERCFEESAARIEAIAGMEPVEAAASVFYLNSAGNVVVYRPGSAAAQMVALAGGRYVPQDGAGQGSTMRIGLEDFFAAAGDAPVLLYSASIADGVTSRSQLVARAELLASFRAFRESRVYCMEGSFFQQPTRAADTIAAMRRALTGGEPEDVLTRLD